MTKNNTKQKLIEAMYELIAKEGYEKASINKVFIEISKFSKYLLTIKIIAHSGKLLAKIYPNDVCSIFSSPLY